MQTLGNSATTAALSPEALIEIQRNTIAEHIKHEEAKDWPEVARTFTPQSEDAYYDVVPFHMRFQQMKGVMDFYQSFAHGFPDFHITVHTQHDIASVSVLEVQITGTHEGEYCGIQATGRRVSVAIMAYFLFHKTTGHLNAERIYFDNNTILAQIKGEMTPGYFRPQPHRTGVEAVGAYRVKRGKARTPRSGPRVTSPGRARYDTPCGGLAFGVSCAGSRGMNAPGCWTTSFPRKHGGNDGPENLQPLCWLCNTNKGAGDATDFALFGNRIPRGNRHVSSASWTMGDSLDRTPSPSRCATSSRSRRCTHWSSHDDTSLIL